MGLFDSIGSALSFTTQGAVTGLASEALFGGGDKTNVESDRSTLSSDYEAMKALGDTEITNYNADLAKAESATLTEGQQAALDTAEKQQKASAAQAYASMGLTGSTMAKSTEASIENAKVISADQQLTENIKLYLTEAQNHYSNAMSAYGLSSADLTNLTNLDVSEAAADQAAMSSLVQTAASVAMLAALV